MKVLKFGGTSVGSVESLKSVVKILHNQTENVVVVVSAFSGITNQLIEATRLAAMGKDYYKNELFSIAQKHQLIINGLLSGPKQKEAILYTENRLAELEQLLQGVFYVRETSDRINDKIMCFGEQMSSYIISKLFDEVALVDSSELIVSSKMAGKIVVDYDLTYKNINTHINKNTKLTIVPGFVSKDSEGNATTLGRGGSDFTGAIFAAALQASILEIWTDVDGFMTADPRIIPSAYPINQLTYAEAMELSHFGAKVIYPPTILPVYKLGIPIVIKNTFNPSAVGTLINYSATDVQGRNIKGISSISNIALVNVQGIGMVGVTGIASRLFTALAEKEINVILISQASSENSISFAIDHAHIDKAKTAIEREFEKEIHAGHINGIHIEEHLSIVAIVGEKMKHATGVAGKLFHTIGKSGINIVAIAQGASELNISFVLKDSDLQKALTAIHQSFFLSEHIDLNMFIIGTGTVGGKLLEQIATQHDKLLKEINLNIKLVGVGNEHGMLQQAEGIDFINYQQTIKEHGKQMQLQDFLNNMYALNLANSVFVDCTASKDIAATYLETLNKNISIVTANKIACSGPFEYYQKLKQTATNKGISFHFETNVGAGLPIIGTIKDLMMSGDKILKIEAVLSGTLNFITNTISKDCPLSETIKQAKEKGFSEPDPRIDLGGTDVARKILILSREAGYFAEFSDVQLNPFIPAEYINTASVDEFWIKVKELDIPFEKDRSKLDAENKKWRYVATMEMGKVKTELREIPIHHPFYDLEGSNNIVMLTTERYKEQPMVIKGYGAGSAVTAAGVFADIIKAVL